MKTFSFESWRYSVLSLEECLGLSVFQSSVPGWGLLWLGTICWQLGCSFWPWLNVTGTTCNSCKPGQRTKKSHLALWSCPRRMKTGHVELRLPTQPRLPGPPHAFVLVLKEHRDPRSHPNLTEILLFLPPGHCYCLWSWKGNLMFVALFFLF